MLVLKFGGTSMGSAQSINEFVTPIVLESFKKGENPVVVVSAMTGTTNDLLTLSKNSIDNKKVDTEILTRIKKRHEAVIATIKAPEFAERASKYLDEELSELRNLIKALITIGEVPPRTFDAILGVGEKLSAQLFSQVLGATGVSSEYCNFDNIITSDMHYNDDVYWDNVASLLAQAVLALPKNCIGVATGFFGRTANGILQDVGRGYSDYCASLLGAALKSKEIQIWTDVNGVLSANPKVVPQAFINREISFDEMAELATFGAKVLHPFSVRPAVNAGIPIRIVNTFNPSDVGTVISQSAPQSQQAFKSIACKTGVTIATISTPQMLLVYGFVAKLGGLLANHQIGVDLISTSEVSVSFSFDKTPEHEDILVADLSELGEVNLVKNQSIISLVGTELSRHSDITSRALSVFDKNKIPINMLSMSNARINLNIVTDDQYADKVTQLLHAEFFTGLEG